MPEPYSPQRFSEKHLSVLIIEDQEEICLLLYEVYSELGHICVPASDGLEALEKLTEREFDLVIADISHPGRNGTELIRIIRAEFTRVDVIAITGNQTQYRYTDLIKAGASDFIVKPFSLDELEAKIKCIARNQRLLVELEELSGWEDLAGLYNQNHFDHNLGRETDRAPQVAL